VFEIAWRNEQLPFLWTIMILEQPSSPSAMKHSQATRNQRICSQPRRCAANVNHMVVGCMGGVLFFKLLDWFSRIWVWTTLVLDFVVLETPRNQNAKSREYGKEKQDATSHHFKVNV
jgi:hypothetical protein